MNFPPKFKNMSVVGSFHLNIHHYRKIFEDSSSVTFAKKNKENERRSENEQVGCYYFQFGFYNKL